MVESKRPVRFKFVHALLFMWTVVFCTAVSFQNGEASALPKEEIISADELRSWQLAKDDFVLFDARGKKSYDQAHIEGAVLPLTEKFYQQEELFRKGLSPATPDVESALAKAMKSYSKDKPIVTYCNRGCHASGVLAGQIRGLGFRNVRDMDEGLQVWQEKGYPVAVGAPRISSDTIGE